MKHESAVQAVKELMRKDSVFRSVIQGWGVATLLIGIFMFYMGANTYIQSYKQTDWVFGSAYITDISELNRSKVGRGGINYSMLPFRSMQIQWIIQRNLFLHVLSSCNLILHQEISALIINVVLLGGIYILYILFIVN